VIPPEQSSEFVAHMEHVLDVYKREYNPDIPVVCMDESPEQLIEECNSTRMEPVETEFGSAAFSAIKSTTFSATRVQQK
jgi:hypothetical protein